jgi:hypothetical protein
VNAKNRAAIRLLTVNETQVRDDPPLGVSTLLRSRVETFQQQSLLSSID